MSPPRSALLVLVAAVSALGDAQPPEALRGAPLDVQGFRYKRTIPAGQEGLVSVPLDAAVLAHSRGPDFGFEDLRIADEEGRQVPYLLQSRPDPLEIALTVRHAPVGTLTARDDFMPGRGLHRSAYRVTLPYSGLPSPRLVLETSDRIFQRRVRVASERPADRRHREPWTEILAEAEWHHSSPETGAPPARLSFRAGESAELVLFVDEGDNRALTITAAKLLLPSWAIRFYRTPQPLTLLYGHDDLRAPRYDLALLAPQVMDATAREIEAAAEQEAEPAAPVRMIGVNGFWIGLAAAVVVLLALIVKLVAGSSGSPSPPAPPGP